MSKKKNNKQNNNAVGGAVGQRQGGQPDTFDQFVARQPAAPRQGATNPYTPITGNDPTGAYAAANTWLANGQSWAAPPPATGGDPGGGGAPDPANAFAPDPNAPFNPALFASFMRHKYWMDNAANRGDDTARFGAGSMRTMAF